MHVCNNVSYEWLLAFDVGLVFKNIIVSSAMVFVLKDIGLCADTTCLRTGLRDWRTVLATRPCPDYCLSSIPADLLHWRVYSEGSWYRSLLCYSFAYPYTHLQRTL